MQFTACIALVLLSVSWSPLAFAELIQRDLIEGSGDGLVTFDSATALEWLDLTATVGVTYQNVAAGTYVTQDGFRFASEGQLTDLWRDAGATGTVYYDPYESVSIVAENYQAARLLVGLMGCTSDLLADPCDDQGQNWNVGWYGDVPPTPDGAMTAATVDYFGTDDARTGRAAMWLDLGQHLPASTLLGATDVGSYLVRSVVSVPEPNELLLLASGLVLLWMRPRARSFGVFSRSSKS
jgi:hypothetical protein